MAKPLSTAQIRKIFLDFFAERGHKMVHSASLVPGNDPTLLFTNAGMVPFKDIFTGVESRDYQRATTAQKCVRAGGKHNDLENVGYTARHHTFFEMLGNFSFGDYFKEDAIRFAWDLITQGYGLAAEKLWVTVYHEDDEAYAIWHEQIGVPKERIVRIGDKPGKGKYDSDNFWAMGDTGPCGPCSEIFYDHGPEVWGGPPGSPEEDGDRYIEIWNLVFMQFERDASGAMKSLPKPSIDTGMGLERIAAVLQGVHSNYEIDIFRQLIGAAARETGVAFSLEVPSLKVIADHIRACAFLIADGVMLSNEGRGYVLRRIIRRAIRHGYKLGQKEPFFYRLVPDLVAEMGGAYPELKEQQTRIMDILRGEEKRFGQTLDTGMSLFNQVWQGMKFVKLESLLPEDGAGEPLLLKTADGAEFAATSRFNAGKKQIIIRPRVAGVWNESVTIEMQDVIAAAEHAPAQRHPYALALEAYLNDNLANSKVIIPGEHIFKLYDTYGFPYDLTADMARELGIELDTEGFEREMRAQRERAKAAGKFGSGQLLDVTGKTRFVGYSETQTDASVAQLFADAHGEDALGEGQHGVVVLDVTPFYGESGGQVGDRGEIVAPHGVFSVEDTQKQGDAFLHYGFVKSGSLSVGDSVQARVDATRRAAIARHHSVTHLLHKALREALGDHVQQKGSLVDERRTRFDFSHDALIAPADVARIENAVNTQILANSAVNIAEMSYDEARNKGAMALFGEKYGDVVRVVSMGDGEYSVELCGGTHVKQLGEIGLAKVIAQGSVSAGVRRIELVAGTAALEYLRAQEQVLAESAALLKTDADHLPERVSALQQQLKQTDREMQQMKRQLAAGSGGSSEAVQEIHGWRTMVARRDGFDNATLRDTADQLRDKHQLDVVVIGSADDDTARLVVSVSKQATALHAGNIIKVLAEHIGGKGGGRPDFAQAGGKNVQGLAHALQELAAALPHK